MDKLLELFEKSLAEYQASIGKKDNLVGCGEIIASEMRKQREQIVTLGRLLADFYASKSNDQRATLANPAELFQLSDFRRGISPS